MIEWDLVGIALGFNGISSGIFMEYLYSLGSSNTAISGKSVDKWRFIAGKIIQRNGEFWVATSAGG